MGVVLKPGAITALFQVPADEFRDQVTSLECVLNIDMDYVIGFVQLPLIKRNSL